MLFHDVTLVINFGKEKINIAVGVDKGIIRQECLTFVIDFGKEKVNVAMGVD